MSRRHPRVIGRLSVWHWRFRHCWWRQVRRPLQIDVASVSYVCLTVLGVTWFLDCSDPGVR